MNVWHHVWNKFDIDLLLSHNAFKEDFKTDNEDEDGIKSKPKWITVKFWFPYNFKN